MYHFITDKGKQNEIACRSVKDEIAKARDLNAAQA